MSERCDRCGAELDYDESREHSVVHVGTYGVTDKAFSLGNGETVEAGTFYHGDSWTVLCPECTKDWRQWYALFQMDGNAIAQYGRKDGQEPTQGR